MTYSFGKFLQEALERTRRNLRLNGEFVVRSRMMGLLAALFLTNLADTFVVSEVVVFKYFELRIPYLDGAIVVRVMDLLASLVDTFIVSEVVIFKYFKFLP